MTPLATACWHQLHPRFQVLQQVKYLRYHQHVGRFAETINCVGGKGLHPLQTSINGDTPFKIPPAWGQMSYICDISPLSVN